MGQAERGKAIGLSQTVISQRLKRLSDEKLIEHWAKGKRLTDQGLEVLEDAE